MRWMIGIASVHLAASVLRNFLATWGYSAI
jgi:hypothetical protein